MNRLGVAILGLDHWYAAFHLAEQVGDDAGLQLVAVADDDSARAEQVARRYGAEATTDYRAALDRPEVQIVAVLYSSERSGAICREAAALGKHILSVKPMALDLRGADEIVQAVAAAGVHFFPLDCLWRLNPDARRIKAWVDEGRIGRPLRYTHTLNSSLPQSWPGASDSGWWLDPARVPGGGWLDHAIYAVDMARWLFGAEPVSVSGTVANMRYPDLKLEDYGAAVFTFANGAVALIEDTWTADRGFGFQRSEVIGSAGTICDDKGPWGRIAARGAFGYDGWVGLEPAKDQGGVMAHMAAVVRGESAPIVSAADGRANLAACLAFYEAARTGKTVKL
ncbi:MAG: Gfo/Idh/MocA family oxidoreductase [Chloroflexota bacterium]